MTQVGDRVRLQRCTDEYTRLDPGDEGTVVAASSGQPTEGRTDA